MIRTNIDTNEIRDIFSTIGLANGNGKYYKERLRKHKQVFDYIVHLNKAIEKLSKKRELIFVDCACGKSYLSFVANYYFTKVKKKKIKFVCIDYNAHVIEASKASAKELGLNNMEFICDDIFNVKFQEKPDIVYSLHACDIATDMTIAKGIQEDAQYIMTVSCCQHTVRNQMRKHSLTSITKHGIYKERLTDMLADSMRSILLESNGYKVKIFEYVPTSETPKNVMVRAVKVGSISKKRKSSLIMEYNKLNNFFNVDIKLAEYIKMH